MAVNRIMIVDDEVGVLRALERVLKDPTFDIEAYENPLKALRHAEVANFDLVLADYRMPTMDGVELLSAIKQRQPDAMRLMLSGYADLNGVLKSINEATVFRFIVKPWDDMELREAIDGALKHRAISIENRYLADEMREQRNQDESAQERFQRQRLESSYPGITNVHWGPDGSVIPDSSDQ